MVTRYSVATPFGLVTRTSRVARQYAFVVVSPNRKGEGLAEWGFQSRLDLAQARQSQVVGYGFPSVTIVEVATGRVVSTSSSVVTPYQRRVERRAAAAAEKAAKLAAKPARRRCAATTNIYRAGLVIATEPCDGFANSTTDYCSNHRGDHQHPYVRADKGLLANANAIRMQPALQGKYQPLADMCKDCGREKADPEALH